MVIPTETVQRKELDLTCCRKIWPFWRGGLLFPHGLGDHERTPRASRFTPVQSPASVGCRVCLCCICRLLRLRNSCTTHWSRLDEEGLLARPGPVLTDEWQNQDDDDEVPVAYGRTISAWT